jgi:hypothetical protein
MTSIAKQKRAGQARFSRGHSNQECLQDFLLRLCRVRRLGGLSQFQFRNFFFRKWEQPFFLAERFRPLFPFLFAAIGHGLSLFASVWKHAVPAHARMRFLAGRI